ncbi:MAG: membrane protein insertase YidC [Planctomycetes bacterium]|nr:membrane protein insertase YidC [Planctomycetota bacterium]
MAGAGVPGPYCRSNSFAGFGWPDRSAQTANLKGTIVVDKRFSLFLVLSFAIILTWSVLRIKFGPPPRPADEAGQGGDNADPAMANQENGQGPDSKTADASLPSVAASDSSKPVQDSGTKQDDAAAIGAAQDDVNAVKTTIAPVKWVTLGSIDPKSGYRMLVTLSSRGAAVDRVELNSDRYHDLERLHGYIGHLALVPDPAGEGCRISAVGAGTPASRATSAAVSGGLNVEDLLLTCQGEPINSPQSLDAILKDILPGDKLALKIQRADQELLFEVIAEQKPIEVLRPEVETDLSATPSGSMLFALDSLGTGAKAAKAAPGAREIAGLSSLRNGPWEVTRADEQVVEFRFRYGERDLAKFDKSGSLEFIKRFRLVPVDDSAASSGDGYHLGFELEVNWTGDEPLQFAYRLEGPRGLPLEGWWYATKISPGWFESAGARDVVWRSEQSSYSLFSASSIFKTAQTAPPKNRTLLFADESQKEVRSLRFLGVDTQYFSAVLLPASEQPSARLFRWAYAEMVEDPGRLDKSLAKTANVSFQLASDTITVAKDQPFEQKFNLMTGPKEPAVLAHYGLTELVEYGWWAYVSYLLGGVLWLFHFLTGNYGIAIIMLTIVVRSCMLPVSFKMTKNAQRMQALAPEMKAISEKYKNDLEKKNRAIQELWKKHNVNPLSGCVPIFFQLPVFAGLYRLLANDITLRESPLIPGMHWCSNLAGPDELCRWPGFFPNFLISETGWLGPYINILPFITIGLFIMNQRLLTPPPTDDQQRMQQQMMTFMMVFFAVMFFKVPSGLCIYFIASSIWTLAEHKILKKGKVTASATPKAMAGSRA